MTRLHRTSGTTYPRKKENYKLVHGEPIHHIHHREMPARRHRRRFLPEPTKSFDTRTDS